MSIFRQLAKNVFSNWAILLLNILISFFLAPYVVHKLGNVYYGIWSIVMQFTGYLYLMDFGVREAVIRYTSKLNAKRYGSILNQIVSTALVLYSAVALACVLVAAIGAWLFPVIFDIPGELTDEVRLVVLLSSLTIAQTLIFNVFTGILMGLQRYDIANVIGVILSIVRAGLIVYLLGEGYKIIGLASVQLFVGVTMGMLLTIYALRLLKNAGIPFKFQIKSSRRFKALSRRLFNYSIFVFINVVGMKIIFSTDAIVIGIFLTVAEVTFYAIAGNLGEYLRKLMSVTASVLNPLASHLDALGEDNKVKAVITSGSRFSLFIGFPVAMTYIILGEEFISLWMGEEYAAKAGAVLIIFGITQLLTFHQYSIKMVLYGLSKHSVIAYWSIVEAIVNLVLSIILVQHYGLVGVALGTAIPHVLIAMILYPIYACKVTETNIMWFWKEVYIRPVIAIIPFALMAWWVRNNISVDSLFYFFVIILLMCVVYAVIAYFVVLKSEEREKVVSIVSRKFSKAG